MSEPKQALDAGLLSDRTLAAWEIVSIIISTVIAEWFTFSVGGGSRPALAIPLVLAFGLMFYSHRVRGEGARALGWRLDNFTKAMLLLAPPMILTSVVLISFGLVQESLNFTRWRGGQPFPVVFAGGFLWGLVQQYALQAFINRRAQILWGRGWPSILFVAVMFAALHLPNPWLMVATFAGGLLWAFV